jgi:DNA repair exonuclease SbcCD ATPase subunit
LLSEQLSTTIKDETEAFDRLNDITSLEDKLESKKRTLDKGIKFYHDNDTCPICDQDITEEFRDQQVSGKQDKVKDIQVAMAKLQQQYDKANNRVLKIYDIQNQITKYQQSVTTEHAQITALRDMIEKIEKYLKEIEGDRRDIAKENKQLLSISNKLAKSEKLKQNLIEESNVLDVASMMLKDKGIKTRIIKQYVPIMNRLINKYLAAMDFFVNFELNEKFEEVIKSRHRDDFSYESFSEGEKMRIDLALLFTWRAIARMKNSTNTNILILDEVFDSSLDSEGTESFLKLIHEVGQSSVVFVISHKGDILTDKFHSVIRFEKHKNFSRIAA